MSQIDRQLLEAAGINVSKAAKLLQKSRQTVSRGISHVQPQYFRAHEVRKLVKYVELENGMLLPMVKKFVEENYPYKLDWVAQNSTEVSIHKYIESEEVWLFLPQIRDLKYEFSELYKELKIFLDKYKGELNVILKDDYSVGEFCSDVLDGDRNFNVNTFLSDLVEYYPITFLFITKGVISVFILGGNGLIKMSPVQANRIFHGLQSQINGST